MVREKGLSRTVTWFLAYSSVEMFVQFAEIRMLERSIFEMKVINSVSDKLCLTYLYNLQMGMSRRALEIGIWSSKERTGTEICIRNVSACGCSLQLGKGKMAHPKKTE